MPIPRPPIDRYTVKWKGNLDKLTSLPEKLEKNAYKVIERYGFLIKEASQLNVPVDQGAAKASHYLVTKEIDGQDDAYTEAILRAQLMESRWGHKGRRLKFAPDDPDELNPKDLQALICVGVIYGMALEEEGSIRAENPGASRPFLKPAFDHYEPQFLNAMGKIFEGAV